MKVLDLALTDECKMISTAEKNFAKLSSCISDQIPVRIDLDPVFKMVPTEPDNIFDGINRILLKFFDVFSEETVPTQDPYRIKI